MLSIWTIQFAMSAIVPLSFCGRVTSLPEPPAIRCHQCHSQTDPGCVQIAINETSFLKPCPPRAPEESQFCRKITQKIYARDNLEVVIRRCGWVKQPEGEEPCYRRRNYDYTETVCECHTDGCNSALHLTASSTVIIMKALLAFGCS